MNRRTFLHQTSKGALAASCIPPFTPALLCFQPADRIAQAIAGARATGRPLLVLVTPRLSWESGDRGVAYGSWLTHADDELLRDLACFDVVCASIAEVAAHVDAFVPATSGPAKSAEPPTLPPLGVFDPWLLVVDADAETVRARVVVGELGPRLEAPDAAEEAAEGRRLAELFDEESATGRDAAKRVPPTLELDDVGPVPEGFGEGAQDLHATADERIDAAIRRRDEDLTRMLREAALDERARDELAERVWARLDGVQRALLREHADAPAGLDASLCDRAAAWLLRNAPPGTPRHAELSARLAASTARRLRERAPSGARWALRDLCGFHAEPDPATEPHSPRLDEESPLPPCGLAHVTEYGRRFLDFFVENAR